MSQVLTVRQHLQLLHPDKAVSRDDGEEIRAIDALSMWENEFLDTRVYNLADAGITIYADWYDKLSK